MKDCYKNCDRSLYCKNFALLLLFNSSMFKKKNVLTKITNVVGKNCINYIRKCHE